MWVLMCLTFTGALYDSTGEHMATYVLAGSMQVLAGCLLLIMAALQWAQKKREALPGVTEACKDGNYIKHITQVMDQDLL